MGLLLGYEMNEPVAWMDGQGNLFKHPDDADRGQTMRPLYLEREWVGLTDEDMQEPRTHIFDFINGARWAEAKLKEKNG